MRHAAPLRPDGCAGAALAEFQRAADDAELGVNLQGAGLNAKRPALHGRSGVTVDDLDAHAAPYELVGEHEAGRAGADDQDVRIHIAPQQQEMHRPDDSMSFRTQRASSQSSAQDFVARKKPSMQDARH